MSPRGRQALGKGLGALIAPPRYRNLDDSFFLCPVSEIRPDPHQPRQRFDDGALSELVDSIREKGVLQPLIVRRSDAGDYLIVAGERRFRAAKQAGLTEIPVLVKDVATDEALELALIENIQRQDLDAIEEALAYERLLQRSGYTQEVVARRVGKQRSTIANAVRLLRLPHDLQQRVIDGALTPGHARAVLSLDEPDLQQTLAQRITEEGLSVRQAEQAARRARTEARAASPDDPQAPPKRPKRQPALKPYFDGVAQEITDALGLPTEVRSRGRRGRVVIEFATVEDLRTLRDRLVAMTEAADQDPAEVL